VPRPLHLLHTCGCTLPRYDPEAPFACCPQHGFGQETVGVVLLHEAIAAIWCGCGKARPAPPPNPSQDP